MNATGVAGVKHSLLATFEHMLDRRRTRSSQRDSFFRSDNDHPSTVKSDREKEEAKSMNPEYWHLPEEDYLSHHLFDCGFHVSLIRVRRFPKHHPDSGEKTYAH